MTSKWSVLGIFSDHFQTLSDARTGKPRIADYISFYLVPLAGAIVGYFVDFRVKGAEGVLAGVAVYTALLFGLIVHVFQLRMRMIDQQSSHSRLAELIDELETNMSYTILVGIVSTGVLIYAIAASDKDSPVNALLSAIIVFLLLHLVLSLLMILKRTRSVYKRIVSPN